MRVADLKGVRVDYFLKVIVLYLVNRIQNLYYYKELFDGNQNYCLYQGPILP